MSRTAAQPRAQDAAPEGAAVSWRVLKRMATARPGWMAVLRVTLAGHLDLRGAVAGSVGGTRSRVLTGALVVLAVLGVGAAEFGVFFFFHTLHLGLAVAGQPLALPVMAVMASQLLVLVFGVGLAVSSLFFSADVPRLMAMPLEPAAIMGVRFGVLYLDVLLVTVLATAPVFAAASVELPPNPLGPPGDPGATASLFDLPIRFTRDPLHWAAVVWLWLFIPLLPLGLAALVAVLVGRGTAIRGRRDLLYVLGSLAGIALAMGYQYVNLRLMPRVSDPEELARMLQVPNALILEAVRYYPPARWAAEALMGPAAGPPWPSPLPGAGAAGGLAGRLVRLGLFAAVSLAATVPAFALARRWYFAGVQAGLEEPQARRRLVSGKAAQAGAVGALLGRKARGPVMALAAREWRLLLRTPPFALPVLTNLVVPPALVAMAALLVPAGDEGDRLRSLLQALDPGWLAAGLAGLILFVAGTNQVSATSVSREGKGFAQVAALPATPLQQVAARLLVGAPFALVGALLMAAASWWVVRPPAGAMAAGLAVGGAAVWPAVAGGLWVDLLRPVTQWDNPQQAMKGNINGLWAMLVSLVAAGVSGGLGYLVLRATGHWGWALGTAGAALLALGGALTWLCVRQAGELFANAGEAG